MFNFLDTILDYITMYRLVLYELIFLLVIAMVFGFFGLMPYSPVAIGATMLLFVSICYITNHIFSFVFEAPINSESSLITALILALIASPIHSYHDLPFLGWLAVWSMAGKYIFALYKKHLFNPVAIAAVLVSFFLGQNVTWWVGTSIMAPFVLLCGLLIVRKIQREDLVFSFFFSSILTTGIFTMLRGGNILSNISTIFLSSSLLFFGFVMLTEPLTTPPSKKLQVLYGLLVGVLFSPSFHIGTFFLSPEMALVAGNVFSFLVSPKQKLFLRNVQRVQVGSDEIDFIFALPEKLSFSPGQYMEWTLPHKHTDSRGNRRYFTLASSPTEQQIRLGVKFYPNGSSYKKALANFSAGNTIVAGSLAGDFTLPKDATKKLVFLAGGIGITPFRSMVKYLLDTGEKRDIVLLYSNKITSEIMYADIWNQASQAGVKVVYTLTDLSSLSANWQGEKGRITPDMIQREIPDYTERLFYLSGPHSMIVGFEEVLKQMGVSHAYIKKDFFPGFV